MQRENREGNLLDEDDKRSPQWYWTLHCINKSPVKHKLNEMYSKGIVQFDDQSAWSA